MKRLLMAHAACLLTTLSACAAFDLPAAATPLPDLPRDLRAECQRPDTVQIAGRDARAVIAELRGELRMCGGKHVDLVAFYDGVRGAK